MTPKFKIFLTFIFAVRRRPSYRVVVSTSQVFLVPSVCYSRGKSALVAPRDSIKKSMIFFFFLMCYNDEKRILSHLLTGNKLVDFVFD